MKPFKTLWKGDWVSVISPEGAPYETLHEKDIILCLPIKEFEDGHKEVGIREEYCPPYFVKDAEGEELYYTVLSGKIDDGETPKQTLIRELKEESGVVFSNPSILTLYENLPICKSTTMRGYCYIISGKEFTEKIPKGDGTANEKRSRTIWVPIKELSSYLEKPNIDALLFSLINYAALIVATQFIDRSEVTSALPASPSRPPQRPVEKGVVVDMYEVEYPVPANPLKETEALAEHLDEQNDFINQYLFPSTSTEDVLVTLQQREEDNAPDKQKALRNRSQPIAKQAWREVLRQLAPRVTASSART